MTTLTPGNDVTLAREQLARALRVDAGLARVCEGLGLDVTCAPLIAWLPAIELAWLDGLTTRERRRLRTLIAERHGDLSDRAQRLLDDWLTRLPAAVLFRTARRVLRAQLTAVPPVERPALRARVLGPCVDLADVSGGVFGRFAVWPEEQRYLDGLAMFLRLPDDPSPRQAA